MFEDIQYMCNYLGCPWNWWSHYHGYFNIGKNRIVITNMENSPKLYVYFNNYRMLYTKYFIDFINYV